MKLPISPISPIGLITLISLLFLTSCVNEDEYPDNRTGNFEALWTILDEHYCFFEDKQKEYGLDWNEVYHKYKVRVNEDMTGVQLFEVLGNMLSELRDGHVNLYQLRLRPLLELAGRFPPELQRLAGTSLLRHRLQDCWRTALQDS